MNMGYQANRSFGEFLITINVHFALRLVMRISYNITLKEIVQQFKKYVPFLFFSFKLKKCVKITL